MACVAGQDIILIEDVRLPLEVGDRLSRKLPNGLTDEFIVDDPGYCEGLRQIAAHYQVKVRRAAKERTASDGTAESGPR